MNKSFFTFYSKTNDQQIIRVVKNSYFVISEIILNLKHSYQIQYIRNRTYTTEEKYLGKPKKFNHLVDSSRTGMVGFEVLYDCEEFVGANHRR